jgi:flagellar export protein FliJ
VKRRSNPFTVLSRLRAIDERQARAALANARDAHERARERLEAYKERYQKERTPSEILTPLELRSLQLRGFRSYETMMEAAAAFERSQRHLDAKAGSWRRAAADLDAVERLETKRNEETARRARAVADRSLDELLGMLHARGEAAS